MMYSQGSFGNSVNMAGNLWQHRIRVCGTLRHNRDILKRLKEAAELMGW